MKHLLFIFAVCAAFAVGTGVGIELMNKKRDQHLWAVAASEKEHLCEPTPYVATDSNGKTVRVFNCAGVQLSRVFP